LGLVEFCGVRGHSLTCRIDTMAGPAFENSIEIGAY
jgi:hypothetical protein